VSDSYRVRRARPEDVPRLPSVEREAATLYRGHADTLGLTPEALERTNTVEDFRRAQRTDLLWVATTAADGPVGFALLCRLDQWLHLDELDVLPEHGRRGVGSALLQRVCEWAAEDGFPGVTLSTFRDVPWNAPFYERRGFEVIPPEALTPDLKRLVKRERQRGLRTDLRVVMRFHVNPGEQK